MLEILNSMSKLESAMFSKQKKNTPCLLNHIYLLPIQSQWQSGHIPGIKSIHSVLGLSTNTGDKENQ